MGYRVIYGQDRLSQENRGKTIGIRTLTALCFGIFALLVRCLWPEGRELLMTYLLPGQQSVTQAAFTEFLVNLRQGSAMVDAFTVFCKEILYEVA